MFWNWGKVSQRTLWICSKGCSHDRSKSKAIWMWTAPVQSRKMIGMMGSSVLNLRHWILTNSKVITCFFRLSFIDVPVTARDVNDVVLFIGGVSNSFQFCLSQYANNSILCANNGHFPNFLQCPRNIGIMSRLGMRS